MFFGKADICYCASECDRIDCFRHSTHADELFKNGEKYLSFAYFDKTSRCCLKYEEEEDSQNKNESGGK